MFEDKQVIKLNTSKYSTYCKYMVDDVPVSDDEAIEIANKSNEYDIDDDGDIILEDRD